MAENYAIERVDNGWSVKYETSKGIKRVEVYEDGEHYLEKEMQIKESLHIALYNMFYDHTDDAGPGGVRVTLIEPEHPREESAGGDDEAGEDDRDDDRTAGEDGSQGEE
tara:strand:+ start:37 stop:363 length:327 start_codon:yes stop_codon:yes gene_type:complete